jgi:Translation initiation factor IF-2, N-terminal region
MSPGAAALDRADVERDGWRMYTGQLLPPSAGTAKPRVYQLAAELGVESKIIMAKLHEMGELIRSASSTIDHLAAHKLRL